MPKIGNADIENWFTYHSPDEVQAAKYVSIRSEAKRLALTIVANCPASADTTASIRLLRQAVMTANQAIACEVKEAS